MKSQAAPPTAARAISFKNMTGRDLYLQTIGLLQGRSSFKSVAVRLGLRQGSRRRSQDASDQAQ